MTSGGSLYMPNINGLITQRIFTDVGWGGDKKSIFKRILYLNQH